MHQNFSACTSVLKPVLVNNMPYVPPLSVQSHHNFLQNMNTSLA